MIIDRREVVAGLVGVGVAGAAVKLQKHGAAGLIGPAPLPARAADWQESVGSGPIAKVRIKPVPLGAGGYVTGLDISRDGKRFVCRTDVCNAYVRNRNDAGWHPLFSPQTMSPSDYDPLPPKNKKADGDGVAGVRIAPSNKDRIYASFLGYVWRSDDGGKTIRRTSDQQWNMPSNAGWQRTSNRTIDVHPQDADRLLLGTWGEGAWFSQDAGKSWQKIALPEPQKSVDNQPGVSMVLFDERQPDTVYVFVTGSGLHISHDGPAGPYRHIAESPLQCSNLVWSPKGEVFLCELTRDTTGRFWKYSSPKGIEELKAHAGMKLAAVDHTNPDRILASGPYGDVIFSTDGGQSWSQVSGAVVQGGEVGWVRGLVPMSYGEMLFDPLDPSTVFIANGVGVFTFKPDEPDFGPVDWSAGIEELCSVSARSVPGGKTFLTAWDKTFWRLDSEDKYSNDFRYPMRPGKKRSQNPISHGFYIDYALDDPRYLVGVASPGSSFGVEFGPGYTSDGGDTWTMFEGTPPRGWGYGGCIAASTHENFVLLPSNNGIGAWTKDGGKSWNSIRLDGVNETGNFANAFYVARKNITADKTRPGVFALVYTVIQPGSDVFGNPLGGMWLTTNGGETWRQTMKGIINDRDHSHSSVVYPQDNRQFWRCQIEYVPEHSRELVYTPYADSTDDRLWWSRDDGASWKELHSSIRAVRSFGFGPPAPGQTRPSVYFSGVVDKVLGIYASFDWFATKPVLVIRNPSPLLAEIIWVEGDRNRFGRAYLGAAAGGWLMLDVALKPGALV